MYSPSPVVQLFSQLVQHRFFYCSLASHLDIRGLMSPDNGFESRMTSLGHVRHGFDMQAVSFDFEGHIF